MPRYPGLLYSAWALIVGAVLFYLLSVGGVLFGGASATNDLGVYSVTIITLLLGIGTFLLRRAKLTAPGPT